MTVECSFIRIVQAHFDRPTSPRVRFYELAQEEAIAHSLLLDRGCETTYLSIRRSSAGY